MQLQKIKLHNFKCFADLDLELETKPGLFLITGQNQKELALGSNGSGKSTLFDAICWCLYGKTSKGVKAADLLSWTSQDTTYSVTLVFDTGTIYRSWQPNHVQINDEEVSQDKIHDFLGITYDQFLYTILFPQLGTQFIDLTAGGKLQFLSELFGLEKWTKAADFAREVVKSTKNDHNILLVKADTLQVEIVNTLQNIDDLNVSIENWNTRKQEQINLLETEIKELESEVIAPESDEHAQLLTDQVEVFTQAFKQVQHVLLTTSSKLAGTRVEYKHAKQRYDQIETELDTLVNSKVCPTCNQKIECDNLDELTTSLRIEFDHLSKEVLPQLELAIENLINEQKSLESQKSQLTHDSDAAYQTLQTYTRQVVIKQEKRKQLIRLTTELQTVKGSENPYKSQIDRHNQRLVMLDETIHHLGQEITDTKQKIANYEFWGGLFPQIRLKILNNLTTELELYFNESFSKIGLMDWSVQISTQRELADERLKNELNILLFQKGQETSLKALSGGELQRVRLISAVGLSELIKSHAGLDWTLIMFDEPLASLSIEGINEVLDLFRSLGDNGMVTMLAEHRVLDLVRFDHVYEIIKKETGISEITTK